MNTLWKALQWVPETTSDTRSYGIHAYVPCFLLSQFPVVKWYKIFWGFPILMGQLQLDPHKKTGWSWFIHSSIFMFTTPKKLEKPKEHRFSMGFPWFFHGFVLFKRIQTLEMIQNGLVLPTVAKRQKKDLGGSQKPLRLVMPWFIQMVYMLYIYI